MPPGRLIRDSPNVPKQPHRNHRTQYIFSIIQTGQQIKSSSDKRHPARPKINNPRRNDETSTSPAKLPSSPNCTCCARELRAIVCLCAFARSQDSDRERGITSINTTSSSSAAQQRDDHTTQHRRRTLIVFVVCCLLPLAARSRVPPDASHNSVLAACQ